MSTPENPGSPPPGADRAPPPTQSLQNEITTLLAKKESARSIAMFLGAGAAYDDEAVPESRLPLGTDVMDHLLEARYEEPSSIVSEGGKAAARRVDFTTEHKDVLLTPDNVWEHLIQGHGAIQRYQPVLERLFSRRKPIPPAYYMVARWFLTGSTDVCLLTTNYDEHFDRALQDVAAITGRDTDGGVHLLAVLDDFPAQHEAHRTDDTRVFKIHGTLSHPWSIIAGNKENAMRTADHRMHRNWRADPRYLTLEGSLRNHHTWVFVGYSFADTIVPQVIRAALEARGDAPTNIFVVEPHDQARAKATFAACRQYTSLHFVTWGAREFFEFLIRKQEDPANLPSIRLSAAERKLLEEGAIFPGCPQSLLDLEHRRTGVVFDDLVHGRISFDPSIEPDILRLIDTGEVQRLRSIKQLSFVHFKYTGAVHDRFGHVLGVTCLADLLYRRLRADYKRNDEIRQRLKLETSDHLAFCGAALLHDIGHGPFGHAMDLVRKEISWKPTHEDDSERMLGMADLGQSFGDLGAATRDTNFPISKMRAIFKAAPKGGAERKERLHPMKTAISTDDSLDIDRLDFIVRDTLYAQPRDKGENKGRWLTFAKDVKDALPEIIRNLDPHVTADGGIEFRYRKTQRTVLAKAAELYTYLYANVYYCWENISAQHMLRLAVTEVLKTTKYRFSEILPTVDGELLKILEDFDNPHVRDLAFSLKSRRLFPLFMRVLVRPSNTVLADPRKYAAWQEELKGMSARLKQFCRDQLHANRFMVFYDVKSSRHFPVIFHEHERFSEVLATMPGIVQVFYWPGAKFDQVRLEEFVLVEARKLDPTAEPEFGRHKPAPTARQQELGL